MSYEYFASSLPLLRFGQKPPVASSEIAEKAEGVLGGEDLEALRAVVGGGESGHPFVAAWRDCLAEISNAVAKRRAARREKAAGKSAGAAAFAPKPTAGWHSEVESGVAAAYGEADPLRRHLALCRLKWDLAGELAGSDPFGADAVLAWAVRLLILEEMAAIDEKAGFAVFDSATRR